MANDKTIKDGKLQCDIDTETAEISLLSSGKIDKYEYLDGEILRPNQERVIEHPKFTCLSLGQAFKKQVKTIKEKSQAKKNN